MQLINDRDLDDGRKHLEKALKLAKKGPAGHIHYALGTLAALEGDADRALSSLGSAIEADPKHRIQARVDSDWGEVASDARFAELLAATGPEQAAE